MADRQGLVQMAIGAIQKESQKRFSSQPPVLRKGLLDRPELRQVAKNIGQTLQKFPDTTRSLPTTPHLFTQKDIDLSRVVTSLPGEIVRSTGRTLQRTGQGQFAQGGFGNAFEDVANVIPFVPVGRVANVGRQVAQTPLRGITKLQVKDFSKPLMEKDLDVFTPAKAEHVIKYNAALQIEPTLTEFPTLPRNLKNLIYKVNVKGTDDPIMMAEEILANLPTVARNNIKVITALRNWGKSAEMIQRYSKKTVNPPIEDMVTKARNVTLASRLGLPTSLKEAEKGFINFGAKVGKPKELKVKRAAQQIDRELNTGSEDVRRALQEGNINLDEAKALGGQGISAVDKVIGALKGAKPLRNVQERLYSEERGRRVARVAAVGSKIQGEAGFHAQLGQLKGELPKVEFESLRKQVKQADIDELFNVVEKSAMSPFEKITAKGGLAKILGSQGGQVPTKGELSLLNEIFPPEFTQALLEKRSLMQKLWTGAESALNLPRAVMATADLSAPLRQGIFLIGRPKQFIPAFGQMFKYALNEKAYKGLQADIRSRPTYNTMRDSGLSFTDIGQDLAGREEMFMSNLAEKIPLFGRIAKGSNRAYSGFLNKLRADTFDDLLAKAKQQGVLEERPDVAMDIAKFVNSATGRGDLGALNRAAVVLNSVFFSPRLMASRINLLNPLYYTQLDPFVRKEALKSLLTFGATASSILSLAKLGGADVGVDPRSADFGKIKVGDTRYDPWGGFQQYIVAAYRLISGQMVSSTTGREFNLGEGYNATTREDIVKRLFQSKEAPVLSFITDLLRGETAVGEKVNLPVAIADRFTPMVAGDMWDLVKQKGLEGIMMASPAIFGVGVQTYGNQIPQVTKTPTGRDTVSYRQAPSLGEDIINKVTGTQVSNVPENLQQPIAEQHLQQLKDQAEVDKVKKIVLETGEPQKVGQTWIWVDNGILKTQSPPGSSKELLNQIQGTPSTQYTSYFDKEKNKPIFVPVKPKIKKVKLSSAKKGKKIKMPKLKKTKKIKIKKVKLKKVKLVQLKRSRKSVA